MSFGIGKRKKKEGIKKGGVSIDDKILTTNSNEPFKNKKNDKYTHR